MNKNFLSAHTNRIFGFTFGFAFVFVLLCSCVVDAGWFANRRARRNVSHSYVSNERHEKFVASSCNECTNIGPTKTTTGASVPTPPPLPVKESIEVSAAAEKFSVHTIATGNMVVRACNGASCRNIPVTLERVPGDVDVFVLFPGNAPRLEAIKVIAEAHGQELTEIQKSIGAIKAKLEPSLPE